MIWDYFLFKLIGCTDRDILAYFAVTTGLVIVYAIVDYFFD
jgi:hypothetical protein